MGISSIYRRPTFGSYLSIIIGNQAGEVVFD